MDEKLKQVLLEQALLSETQKLAARAVETGKISCFRIDLMPNGHKCYANCKDEKNPLTLEQAYAYLKNLLQA